MTHVVVDSGTRPIERWSISYEDGQEPSRLLLRAFKTIGENLWPAIKRSKLGGNTYSRCVLTSCAARDFLQARGFQARVTPALLDVSSRRGNALADPRTIGIGEPKLEASGIHVVCEVTDEGRVWIVDASTRQAARPHLGLPPEVIVAAAFASEPSMDPQDGYLSMGFRPLAATSIDQGDGTRLLFQWLHKADYPDYWSGTPDADPERSKILVTRLDAAWARLRSRS